MKTDVFTFNDQLPFIFFIQRQKLHQAESPRKEQQPCRRAGNGGGRQSAQSPVPTVGCTETRTSCCLCESKWPSSCICLEITRSRNTLSGGGDAQQTNGGRKSRRGTDSCCERAEGLAPHKLFIWISEYYLNIKWWWFFFFSNPSPVQDSIPRSACVSATSPRWILVPLHTIPLTIHSEFLPCQPFFFFFFLSFCPWRSSFSLFFLTPRGIFLLISVC